MPILTADRPNIGLIVPPLNCGRHIVGVCFDVCQHGFNACDYIYKTMQSNASSHQKQAVKL